MSRNDDEVKKVTTRIQNDSELLTWARGSIRYNDGRAQQARDFIAKLKNNGVTLIASVDTIKGALSAIEQNPPGAEKTVKEFATEQEMHSWLGNPDGMRKLKIEYPPTEYGARLDLVARKIIITRKGDK